MTATLGSILADEEYEEPIQNKVPDYLPTKSFGAFQRDN
jgi:hypothetical protein